MVVDYAMVWIGKIRTFTHIVLEDFEVLVLEKAHGLRY